MVSLAKFCFILIILGAYMPASFSREKKESFNVDIYDKYLRVVSPSKSRSNLSAIFNNNTLETITARVQYENGDVVSYLSIPSRSFKTVRLGNIGKRRVFFVPLAPSFQEAELIIGRQAYEIPPKK